MRTCPLSVGELDARVTSPVAAKYSQLLNGNGSSVGHLILIWSTECHGFEKSQVHKVVCKIFIFKDATLFKHKEIYNLNLSVICHNLDIQFSCCWTFQSIVGKFDMQIGDEKNCLCLIVFKEQPIEMPPNYSAKELRKTYELRSSKSLRYQQSGNKETLNLVQSLAVSSFVDR